MAEDPASKRAVVAITREHIQKRRRQIRHPKVRGAAQRRVSEKIGHLVRTGEVPNTEKGRKQAAAIAYAYERRGKLGGR